MNEQVVVVTRSGILLKDTYTADDVHIVTVMLQYIFLCGKLIGGLPGADCSGALIPPEKSTETDH